MVYHTRHPYPMYLPMKLVIFRETLGVKKYNPIFKRYTRPVLSKFQSAFLFIIVTSSTISQKSPTYYSESNDTSFIFFRDFWIVLIKVRRFAICLSYFIF